MPGAAQSVKRRVPNKCYVGRGRRQLNACRLPRVKLLPSLGLAWGSTAWHGDVHASCHVLDPPALPTRLQQQSAPGQHASHNLNEEPVTANRAPAVASGAVLPWPVMIGEDLLTMPKVHSLLRRKGVRFIETSMQVQPQHSTAQRSAAQHSTAQHSAAQRSAAQRSTPSPEPSPCRVRTYFLRTYFLRTYF